jgi:hypothetical protein
VGFGDSGSPLYTGDPDGGDVELVTVVSRLAHGSRPVWDAAVRDWLALRAAGIVAGVYVGPADGPLGSDSDGDGLSPVHDVCPLDFDPDQLDGDRDGVGNVCDLCPSVRGGRCDLSRPPGERGNCCDTDGDGRGDCCDNCPGVANAGQENRDGDRHGDVCDNCVDAPNDLQQNCNVDAENAAGIFDGPGDACDPVRCGETLLSVTSAPAGGGVVIETTDRIELDGRQADASEEYSTAFRFCRCGEALRDVPASRSTCADGLSACSIADVIAFGTPAEPTRGWRRVTWTRDGVTSSPGGAASIGYAPLETRASRGGAEESFLPDFVARWLLRGAGSDVERWSGAPLFDTFPTGPGAAGAIPGMYWTYASAPAAGADVHAPALPHHDWSGPIDAPREVSRLPGGAYRCLDFLAPLLSRTGSAASLSVASPLAFIARPGLLGTGTCVFDRSTPLIVASDVVRTLDGLDLPGLPAFDEPAGLWVAASETGGWLEADGIRYAGVEPGAELPLVRRTLLETPRGLEPLDKLNPCPNCPCPQCPPEPFPTAGMADAAAHAAGATVEDPGVFVLSAGRRTLWRLGGTTEGQPRETIGFYVPDTDTWRSSFVPGGLGRVLAATYSAPGDALYVLSEREPESAGRGRPRSRTLTLLRLDPDDDAVAVLAEWPRTGRHDVFGMSVDPVGDLYLAASRTGGRDHVGALVRFGDGGIDVVQTFDGPGYVVPYGVRAEENGVTLVVTETSGPTAVSHPRRPPRSSGGPRGPPAEVALGRLF